LEGSYSHITKFTLPDKGYLEEPVSFTLGGHYDSYAGWPNFAIGLYYADGPVGELDILVNGRRHTLSRGSVLAFYVYNPSVCLNIDVDASVKFNVEGVYRFSALTGYVDVDEGVFYYDDRVDKSIEVREKPVIPGWPEWMPWWVLPLAGGMAAVAVVAGVVAYQERERMYEMMLLMRRGE